MGVELESVDVPVGATGIEMRSWIRVKEGVDPDRAKRFLASAERYCSANYGETEMVVNGVGLVGRLT